MPSKELNGMFVSNSLGIGLRLLLSIALARLLSPYVLGQYSFVLSVLGLFALTSLPSINSMVIVAVSQGKWKTYFDALKTRFNYGLIGLVLIAASIFFFQMTGRPDIAFALMVSSILFIAMNVLTLNESMLLGLEEFNSFSLYKLFDNVLCTVPVILVAWFAPSLPGIVSVGVIFPFVFRLIYYFGFDLKKDEYKKKGFLETDFDAIKKGKQLSYVNILTGFATKVDKILVAVFLGFEVAAVYWVLMGIASKLRELYSPVLQKLLPSITGKSWRHLFDERFLLVYFAGCCFSFVLAWIIPFIFGEFYGQYYWIAVIIFCAAVLAFSIDLKVKVVLASRKKVKEINKINAVFAVSYIGLQMVLGYFFGLVGFAFALFASRALIDLYSLKKLEGLE